MRIDTALPYRQHLVSGVRLAALLACAILILPTSPVQADGSCGFTCPDGSTEIKLEWYEYYYEEIEGKKYLGYFYLDEHPDERLYYELRRKEVDGKWYYYGKLDKERSTLDVTELGFEVEKIVYKLEDGKPYEIDDGKYKSEIVIAYFHSLDGTEINRVWLKADGDCREVCGTTKAGLAMTGLPRGGAVSPGISHLTFCIKDEPPCPEPQFVDFGAVWVQERGRVELKLKITGSVDNPITEVNFIDQTTGDPHLVNLKVESSPGMTSTDGVHFVPDGAPVTEVEFLLVNSIDLISGQTYKFEYFVEIKNSCGTKYIDPVYTVAAPRDRFVLDGNYPNPFNPSTVIRYTVSEASDLTLTVYDISGREVKQLVSGMVEAGTHEVTWDGTNADGLSVAGGVYLYRIQSGHMMKTGKMVLLK